MANERPVVADDDHRVLKFQPRTSADPPKQRFDPHSSDQYSVTPTSGDDLSRFERSGEPDDYSHRMMMNAAAGLVTIALTAFGIWLAMSIGDLRRTQDCILAGHRDCAVIARPAR